jgi:hypothetical protein
VGAACAARSCSWLSLSSVAGNRSPASAAGSSRFGREVLGGLHANSGERDYGSSLGHWYGSRRWCSRPGPVGGHGCPSCSAGRGRVVRVVLVGSVTGLPRTADHHPAGEPQAQSGPSVRAHRAAVAGKVGSSTARGNGGSGARGPRQAGQREDGAGLSTGPFPRSHFPNRACEHRTRLSTSPDGIVVIVLIPWRPREWESPGLGDGGELALPLHASTNPRCRNPPLLPQRAAPVPEPATHRLRPPGIPRPRRQQRGLRPRGTTGRPLGPGVVAIK